MKILFLVSLLITSSSYADTFLVKGVGESKNTSEELARTQAIKAATLHWAKYFMNLLQMVGNYSY